MPNRENTESVCWAKSELAQAAGEAISALLNANRMSSRTVQWMPEGDGCRFEIIHRDGTRLAIAHVDPAGAVRLVRVRAVSDAE